MKQLPIGIDDFKKLVTENYYFIDKSLFIRDILQDPSQTIFLPRPRRFGKTLNMSMLKYFLTNKNSDENLSLFNDLEILTEKEVMLDQGKYPVIYISFKDIKEDSWEDCFDKIKNMIQKLFNEYEFLLDEESLTRLEKRIFEKILFGEANKADYEDSLRFLSQLLSKYYKQNTVILIDEYDQPIVAAYSNNYFEKGRLFFRNMYSAALKDNISLKKGILTGILRISKESIFSGLNNLFVDSLLDNQINYFGWLEKEVIEILDHYDMSYKLNDVREWYNGYKFGESYLYNPWSIINFIKTKKLKSHWVNTSRNELIRESLSNISKDEYNELISLINNNNVKIRIQENISFEMIDNPAVIWNLMLFSGYLTLNGDELIKFPNREIREFYIEEFKTLAGYNINKFNSLLNYLLKKDLRNFEMLLKELFIKALSFYDTDLEQEKYYHNLILGLVFGLESQYVIHSNREYGTGRVDLLLKSKDVNLPNYIFEFKVSKKNVDLKKLSQEALNQISQKRYDFEIDTPIKIGMAFHKKEFEMSYEM